MAHPLAYFLTWTTYGTWLPGDDRGWTDKGKGFQLPNRGKTLRAKAQMNEDGIIFDDQQRVTVEQIIKDHCAYRKWILHAVNCRTNHVHVVVWAPDDVTPEVIMSQFKSWCTRRLKELELARSANEEQRQAIRKRWWTEGGSKRYINDKDGVAMAVSYTENHQ